MKAREKDTYYITLLGRGDHEAFRAIFDDYYPGLKRFVVSLLKSDNVADDLVQDIFCQIWAQRDRLAGIDSLQAYMFRMARNAVYDYFRHQIITQKGSEKYQTEREYTPEEVASVKEMDLLIHIVVENMPHQRRHVFELSRYAGKSNEEIAQMLGISKRSVETHISAALKELRKFVSIWLTICA